MRHRAPLVAAVLIAVLTTGCGGQSPAGDSGESGASATATTQAPRAGQCVRDGVQDGSSDAPDFSTVVACTEAHRYEVTGVVDVPAWALTPGSDSAAGRARLGDPDLQDPGSKRWLGFVEDSCEAALRKQTHLTRIQYKLADANKSGPARYTWIDHTVAPALWGVKHVLSLSPVDLWTEGHHQLVCSVGYGSDADASDPIDVESPTEQSLISLWATKAFPLDHRVCVVSGGTGPCDQPHLGEAFATIDVGKALNPDTDVVEMPELREWNQAIERLQEVLSRGDLCAVAHAALGAKKVKPPFWVHTASNPAQKAAHQTTCLVAHLDNPPLFATQAFEQPAGFGLF